MRNPAIRLREQRARNHRYIEKVNEAQLGKCLRWTDLQPTPSTPSARVCVRREGVITIERIDHGA